MSYHRDKGVSSAIIRLMDELCEWERNTGRRTTLLLIPHSYDEEIMKAQDGKPITTIHISPEDLLRIAMDDRRKL